EDRGDGRALRGERRAAQLLRPSLLDDRRAFLRRRTELSRDGNRHRQRALARRTGDASARVREWRADPADAPRLGDGHQRGGCARASGEGVARAMSIALTAPGRSSGESEDGLRIVLTPVQLAALLRGETITEPETSAAVGMTCRGR